MKKLAKNFPLNILIAEDNYINQKLLRDILTLHGYRCDSASSGYEALEMMRKKNFDLVLMDIQMPGMSGEETTRQIHDVFKADAPKIIAVTAYAMAEDRDRCIAAGMDGYISKPFRVNELVNEIVRVMKMGK